METTPPLPGPSTQLDRALDLLSELTGWFRIRALFRRSAVSWRASVKSPSRLTLGRHVVVERGSILHAGGKAWCNFSGHIRLGDGVRIGPGCVIFGSGGVELANYTHLGPGVKIISQAGRHSANRETSEPDYNFNPVMIGAGTWVGAGAVLLGGARLGRCVTVAPNSVVTGEVPDFAVVAGNPGRVMFYNGGAGDD